MLYAHYGCRKFLLLVDQTTHKQNWKAEFEEAFKDKELGDMLYGLCTVECYASLKKYEGTEWDCVICDEAHHLRGENRTDSINTLKTDRMLLLSATMSDHGDADLLMDSLTARFGKFRQMDFGVWDGIAAGFIGTPRIYVNVIDLENVEAQQEIKVSWGFKNARRTLITDAEGYRDMWNNRKGYPNMDLTIRCSAKDAYAILSEQTEAYGNQAETMENDAFLASSQEERANLQKKAVFMRTMQRNCGARRKSLLGHCKTEAVARMIGQMEAKKTKYLCFCTDIKQIKLLGGDGDCVIHSGDGRSKKTNQQVIDAFNADKIRALFAVDMVREGQNLRGIEAGIIIQLDGKERQFVQRFGRVLRSREPLQMIYVAKDTVDEKWFLNAMDGVDTRYVSVHMPGDNKWRKWNETPYAEMLDNIKERELSFGKKY